MFTSGRSLSFFSANIDCFLFSFPFFFADVVLRMWVQVSLAKTRGTCMTRPERAADVLAGRCSFELFFSLFAVLIDIVSPLLTFRWRTTIRLRCSPRVSSVFPSWSKESKRFTHSLFADGQEFKVEVRVAKMSETIKNVRMPFSAPPLVPLGLSLRLFVYSFLLLRLLLSLFCICERRQSHHALPLFLSFS